MHHQSPLKYFVGVSPRRNRNTVYRRRLAVPLLAGSLLASTSGGQANAAAFDQTNLITDNQAVNAADITDAALLNPWGVSYGTAGPFWVSNNGSGTSTLYTVDPTTNATTKDGLTVAIPGQGTPTGQVNNPSTASGAFNGDNFLFVSEDGTISGWRGALGTTAQTLLAGSNANVYKGSAIAVAGGNTYLYAANFRTGKIDVLKGSSTAPNLTGNFVDPGIPAGYAPFNIQKLGSVLYVTYALQDALKHDEVDGAGLGFVSEFDLNGNFIKRVASNGPLDAPWGLAIAPASFDNLAGDLLVGNFGDGEIDAFNGSGAFVGALTTASGSPVVIDGLWALTVGNDGSAGSSNDLYFSAGPNSEADGLFGVLIDVPEPASLTVFGLALVGLQRLRRRRT